MTKTIWTGTFGAIVGAATIAALAQAPAPQQGRTQSSTPSAQSSAPASSTAADHKITVTGCLQAAPSEATDQATTAGTAGTSGTAGAAGAASDQANAKFVLADAKLTPAEGGQSAPESAGAASASAPGASAEASQPAQTYRLLANPASLSPHVGKKLELTGTLVDDQGSASASANETGAAAKGPMLRVEAGKVLASSCQQ